jgi:hypothetical protein
MTAFTENPIHGEELDIASMQLGIDSMEILLHLRQEVCTMAQTLAAQAQHGLMLLTLDLEPAVFDRQPFLNAISQLARRRQDSCFRILVLDSRRALQQGHRLIELSRRLGPAIQFRCPPPEYRNTGKTVLLVDDVGYVYRPLASRYEGTANFNNPGEVARQKKYFTDLWDRSAPDSGLRLLHT